MDRPSKEVHRRVAAVCYRRTPCGLEFLLVRTWDGEWTFPKGMIDDGMTETKAAELEAWEEGGVRGEIEPQPFTDYIQSVKKSSATEVHVNAYLFEVHSAEPPPETHRKPRWFAPAAAKQALAKGRSAVRAQQFDRVIDLATKKISAS